MVDLQASMVFLGTAVDRVKKFNWSNLVPRFRVDTYDYGTAGIGLTWRQGVGLGLGLGRLDVWAGWPRNHEGLHTEGCLHEKVAEPVDS